MIKISFTVPYKSNFFPLSEKITEVSIRKKEGNIDDGIRTEYCDFNNIYNILIKSIDFLEKIQTYSFLTTYGKNKREKVGDTVKFYFVMDGEPGYDNDEYEFIFEDTFESLQKAIMSFEEEAKKYLS